MRKPNCKCEICSTGFYCPPSRKAIGWGKYCSKLCMGLAKKGRHNPNLKYVPPQKDYEQLTYSGIHNRIRKLFGKPHKCENCGSTTAKKFEWANISHRYLLDRSDWARLCTSCHVLYDKNKLELSCV